MGGQAGHESRQFVDEHWPSRIWNPGCKQVRHPWHSPALEFDQGVD